jgi:outer membrane protein OmpA-like peptidoglycan-associated protein
MFIVTATDVEGRETSLSRFLLVRPSPAEEKAALARPAQQKAPQKETITASGVKTRTVGAKGTGAPSGKLLNKGAALKKAKAKALAAKKAAALKKARGGKKKAPEAAAEGEGENAPAEQPAKGDAAGEFSSQVSYKIYFKENTASITANSEKKLAQVAETLGYYPMANISLTGYAYSGEANADAMAENRVNYVAARLADKYKIDRTRMDVQSKVSETPKSIVEIKMSGKE